MADVTLKEIAEAVPEDYRSWALQSRRRYIELRLGQDPEIRALYLRGARAIGRKLKSREFATPGAKLYQKHLEELEKVLKSEADTLRAGLTKKVDNYISQGSEAGGRFSKMVTVDVLNKAGLKDLPVQTVFAQANRKAIEACYARSYNGLFLSDRIWKTGTSFEGAVRNIIQEAVATNQDPVETARMLEKYVKKGSKTLARDYPKMMKRMKGRIPGDVCYEALRLARTEMTAAYGESVIASAKVDPSATGIKWVLSESHPLKDICDTHATADGYGLGPGVYPIDKVPLYPAHGNELCHLQVVNEDPDAFVDKLIQWKADPKSQPAIEEWYKNGFSDSKPVEEGKGQRKKQNKKVPAKATVSKAEQEIERVIKDAPLNDRINLASHLLDMADIDNCEVSIQPIGARGLCRAPTVDKRKVVDALVLQADDSRPYRYKIKTVFHEATHARMNGYITDEKWLGDPDWLDVEETVAESVAHFMVRKAGIEEEIAPAYSERLIRNLPKLKRLPEYSQCTTIADFGRVLSKYRYEERTARWMPIADYLAKETLDVVEYSKQYEKYVKDHFDEIVDLILENNGFAVERHVIEASVYDGWTYRDTDYPGFTDSLIIAMNRLGVR